MFNVARPQNRTKARYHRYLCFNDTVKTRAAVNRTSDCRPPPVLGRIISVSLLCAPNQLGDVQARCYVIFTSSSLRFEEEPVWLMTASPKMVAYFSQDWGAL